MRPWAKATRRALRFRLAAADLRLLSCVCVFFRSSFVLHSLWMLYSVGECASFVWFLAMVIIAYYHLYLAGLRMDRSQALF